VRVGIVILRISRWLRGAAEGGRADATLFAWGFAEAFSWPVIPDAALMAHAFAAPRRSLRLWLPTIAGSAAGGAVGVWLGRRGRRWPLPLTTKRMAHQVAEWLDVEGPGGLRHQPVTLVPYKVFVREAAATDIPIRRWAAWTVGVRGPRMLAAAIVSALVGRLVWSRGTPQQQAATHLTLVAAGVPVIAAVIRSGLRRWS